MKLSTRAGRVVPSPTLSITATAKSMKAKGIDVLDFASGEPDFDTPQPIKDVGIAAIQSGFTKYTASSGIDELRDAVIEKLKREQGLQFERGQVLVSCGAKHSLYNLFQAVIDPGDEVIIPTPFWVSYQDQVLLNDGTPVFLRTDERDGFAIDRAALEAVITPRSKAIVVNSPCNPTGATYSRATLEAIADVACRHNLLIVSDEIYEKIRYDGVEQIGIATLSPEVARRTVIVNGVSKSYAMTGWRIGYAAGPKDVLTAMANIQSQSTSNPTSIAQKAAVAAMRLDDAVVEAMVTEFDRRRKAIVERLNGMPGVTCRLPTGAFYAFPNVSAVLGRHVNDQALNTPADISTYLLAEAKIAVVPGEPFGSMEHIRLSYATGLETIHRGMDRMDAALRRLQ
ncbi:MAG: pyridoxal phosphate-dependent aminotransferase [Nitrospiraceae bacterium]